MRVLATGAGGFLGGHIARRLAEAGLEVIATTRASRSSPRNPRRRAPLSHPHRRSCARSTPALSSTRRHRRGRTSASTKCLIDNVIATRATIALRAAADHRGQAD
jgi:nucleoside-diphosphate-sugar epimerase